MHRALKHHHAGAVIAPRAGLGPRPVMPTLVRRRLEELDRVSVRIFQPGSVSAGTVSILLPKCSFALDSASTKPCRSSTRKTARFHPPGSWCRPSGSGREPGAPGPLSQNLQRTELHVGERRKLLSFQLEAWLLGIERDRASHVAHLVANAMQALHEGVRFRRRRLVHRSAAKSGLISQGATFEPARASARAPCYETGCNVFSTVSRPIARPMRSPPRWSGDSGCHPRCARCLTSST